MPYAVGIDVGTTNSKVVLFELPSCEPVAIERFESPRFADGGKTDYDTHGLICRLLQSLGRCAEKAVADSERVEYISIASIGESGVLVHPDGSYDKRSIFWFDQRGRSYAEQVRIEGFAGRMYEITGIPVHSNSALFKILWLRDHGTLLQDATWLPMADFVAWILCGKMGQDSTLASRTSLLDVGQGIVSEELLEHFNLPTSLFPEVVESGTPRGMLRREVLEYTGLPGSCLVCVSGHDHMSGAVACGLKAGGEALNSTGTSEGLLLLGNEPLLDANCRERGITNGMFVTPGTYSYYASVPAAGFSFQWVLQTLGIDEEEFYTTGQERLYRRYLDGDVLEPEVLYIPHLRGSGPPHRNPDARGALYGMVGTTTRDDIIYGIHTGVSFEFLALCRAMAQGELDVPIKVIGPAARNPLWMQLKADVLGARMLACSVPEAVARGSVIVSGRKLGVELDPQMDMSVYEPDPSRHEALARVYERRFKTLEDAIRRYETELPT